MKLSPLAAAIQPTLIRQITDRARPTSLHLGLGQPDLPLSDAARSVLRETTHAPYTSNRGLDELVSAVGLRYHVDDSEGLMVTCGVQEALAVAILGVVPPGSDVLVPDPGFPAYPNLVRAAGANPVAYGFAPRFALDRAAVEEAWTERTAGIVLNSPSNPTGAVASAAAIEAVVELCTERGGFWISDEIYEDFVWEGTHHSPREFGAEGLVVSGVSKSHSAMGLRIGWLLGPERVVTALLPLHQHLVTSAPSISQVAAAAMLATHDEQIEHVREIFAERRETMLAATEAWPDVPRPLSAGAFYGFVDVSAHLAAGESSVDLALAILDEVDVVTIPGVGFGAGGEGHLRLAYTVDHTILEEALRRVGEFFRQRSSR